MNIYIFMYIYECIYMNIYIYSCIYMNIWKNIRNYWITEKTQEF